jgi:hypothetical protein
MNKKIWIGIAILFISVFAWSPWLNRDIAKQRASDYLQAKWGGVMDGCSLNGIVGANRIPFGFLVNIDYGCGFVRADSPSGRNQGKVYISSFGFSYLY